MQTISNSKRTPVFCFLIIFFCALVKPTQAQYRFQSFFDPDSLKGFNESQAKVDAAANNCFGKEFKNFMARAKRDYINKKYQLPVGNSITFKQMLPSNPVMAACTNMDFEAGNTSGWTLTNGYNTNSNTMAGCCPNGGAGSCIATSGSDPLTGVSLASPLGGNFVCRINNVYNTGNYTERISQTFNVTASNSLLQFAYLAILEAAGHNCVDQPYMNISLRNCSNVLLNCPQVDIQAGCQSSGGFVNAGSYFYTNAWQVGALDLTPYIGSCITIQVTAGACTQGGHWGYGYFDAKCVPMDIIVNGVAFPAGTTGATVSLCGSGTASISAPPGLAPYTWNGPAGSGITNVTSQSFTTITQGQYNLSMNPPGACAPINRIVNFSITMPPLAGFNFTTTPCVAGVNAVSTSSLNGGAALTGYSWSWGDGSPNSTTDPASHTYTAGGTSQIKLVITNAGGCKDSITQSVNITVPPVIDFTTAPVCMGTATSFSNLSTDGGAPVNSYTWNFGGGGGSSNAVNPSVNFATAGVYTVSLYGENADACPGTTVKSITVFPQPVVSFSANPVCFGSTTTFTNASSVAAPSTINNWYWDFTGDNITDNTTQSPTFVYPASGTYTVYLKAVTNGGCMDSTLVNITVNPTPTVNFTTVNACKKYNIVLNNTTAVGAPSSMSSYTWNFGSGTGSSMLSSNAVTPSNLTYSVPGIKTITLTGVTNNGCVGTITQTVDVYASPTASFSSTGVCFGAATTFTDMSGPLAPSTGSITSWAWDYDNNGTVDNSTQTASNSYPSSGNYTVSLIVTSANGCMDTIRKPVTVYGRAVPDFTPTGVCFGTSSTFTNLTNVNVNANTGSASSYTWNFGNGVTSNATNPVYMYTTPSNSTANTTYSATLFVTTSNGCKDSITKPVTVYALPTPDFKSDSVCLGNATTLQDISNSNGNPLLFFSWDWNNDGIADVTNGNITSQNTFTAWGNIAVTHTVYTSPNGGLLNCSSSITKNVWVHPSPVAGLTTTNQCINTQPVQISGMPSTIPTGSISNYAWDYGDGNNNTNNVSATTTHTFANPGVYVITLTVSSGNGCTSAATQSVEVYDKPYSSFVYSKTCFGKTTTITAVPASTGGIISNYDWDYNNTPQSIEASGQQVATIFGAAGQQTLNLMLTSNKGCKNVVLGNVYINYNPKANLFAPKRMGCTDLCIDIMDSTAALTGPAQNISWEWNFGNNQTLTQGSGVTNKMCYSNNSIYNLKKYDVSLVVRTDSGCVDSVRRKNYVVVYPKPVADFNWTGEDGDILTPVISFTNTSQGYSNFQWYWDDALNALDSIHNTPKHYYNTEEPKTINVYLAIRNVYGCKDTVMKPVEIGGAFTFYIPNCFTPNNDGLNDVFTGKGIGIKDYKMWIFDRWGEMLYYTNDINKGWDGSVKGHETDGKMDVYQWKVTLIDIMGKVHHYIGHVTELK